MRGLQWLFAVCALCVSCGDGGESTSVTHRLDPYGISIDLAAGESGGPAGPGYLFTSGGSSSTVTVTRAEAGRRAADRTIHDALPGASTVVEWTRVCMFGGLSGTETRAVESFPHRRVHWIGAVDSPTDVVFIDLATDQSRISGPTDGDAAWVVLRESIRRME